MIPESSVQNLVEHKNYLYRISAILSTRALAEAHTEWKEWHNQKEEKRPVEKRQTQAETDQADVMHRQSKFMQNCLEPATGIG